MSARILQLCSSTATRTMCQATRAQATVIEPWDGVAGRVLNKNFSQIKGMPNV